MMMAVTALDLLAALALLALVSGLSGTTFNAVMLLVQLIAPKPRWIERGAMLVIFALGYLGMLALDVPSILVAIKGGQSEATPESVLRTVFIALWMWTLNTILLMLAKGQLGPQVRWRK
ncbi:hypothetical protein K7W42_07720 [Deinococcus sp. HMF7604]|uniref:hypothetical protein n=1 Tax=Deinococcus betulae TaxID=2873312 RepID=UPI001CC9C37D|nr:hypothetical protein [Deinococcus betulae]MBZ9750747.1 hypothetical protein [Deinococcus betulae]